MRAARYFLRILHFFFRVIIQSRLFIDRDDPRNIYLDIRSQNIGGPGSDVPKLMFQQTLAMLRLSGYRAIICARPNRDTLALIRGSIHLFDHMRLVWRERAACRTAVRFVDSPDTSEDHLYAKNMHLVFQYRPHLPTSPTETFLPFTMALPQYFHHREHERLGFHRAKRRRIRAAFSGNFNPTHYDMRFLKGKFNLLSRLQIIEHLREQKRVREIGSLAELDALLAGDYLDEMILISSQTFRIPADRWLSFLSQVDFFLCPPGILYPPSYNLIETIAVGTIPWTNYPEWVLPGLTHLENCIAFETLEDIDRTLDLIVGMDAAEVAGMRGRVAAFYDEHLELTRKMQQLIESPASSLTLHTIPESRPLLRIIADLMTEEAAVQD